MITGAPTFILTAELDVSSFQWLNGLRQMHFPAERNYLDAHLTLFHHVDRAGLACVESEVQRAPHEPIGVTFAGLRKLGRGVAIAVDSQQLVALRNRLASALEGRLTRQDAQSFRPHVTIQNKVDPAVAKALHAQLAPAFDPRGGTVVAIQVFEYLGGPWRPVTRLPLMAGNLKADDGPAMVGEAGLEPAKS